MLRRSVFCNSASQRRHRKTPGPRIIRLLLFGLSIASIPAFGQSPFHFGVKAGVPATDYFDTNVGIRQSFASNTNRYTVGPEVELSLPHGFAFEIDALYKRYHFTGTSMGVDVFTNEKTTANSWEFPLLLKYRVSPSRIRPFVDAGVSVHHLADIKQVTTSRVFPSVNLFRTTTSDPAELNDQTNAGFVMGGGIELRMPLLRISPELRYTRWGTENFLSRTGLMNSTQNQLEFLVGISF